MAYNFSPKIVTDGLVLYLDAANTRSYVSGSTTWNDLSRSGNNGSLINGPTFNILNGGSIVFDGVDDYSQNSAVNVGLNFTVCLWARPTGTTRRVLLANSYRYLTNNGFLFNMGNNGTDLFLSIGQDQQVAVTTTGYVTANTWFFGCATFNGTTISIYFNGLETNYAVRSGSISSILYNTNPLFMGQWLLNGTSVYERYAGRIAQTQIYNRALSAQEIQQNFNATKTRFGL
jgi:hypothetical protein